MEKSVFWSFDLSFRSKKIREKKSCPGVLIILILFRSLFWGLFFFHRYLILSKMLVSSEWEQCVFPQCCNKKLFLIYCEAPICFCFHILLQKYLLKYGHVCQIRFLPLFQSNIGDSCLSIVFTNCNFFYGEPLSGS